MLGSPCGGSNLQSTSPVLSLVKCVGGWGHSQMCCLTPAHLCGHSQIGVYLIFPFPRNRTHCGVLWPLSGLLAHCQACGATSMGSGIFVGVDMQGAQGREGQAQLALLQVVPCRRGPAAQQLSLLVSSCLPRSPRAEVLTFNIPDVKSHWL